MVTFPAAEHQRGFASTKLLCLLTVVKRARFTVVDCYYFCCFAVVLNLKMETVMR